MKKHQFVKKTNDLDSFYNIKRCVETAQIELREAQLYMSYLGPAHKIIEKALDTLALLEFVE